MEVWLLNLLSLQIWLSRKIINDEFKGCFALVLITHKKPQ